MCSLIDDCKSTKKECDTTRPVMEKGCFECKPQAANPPQDAVHCGDLLNEWISADTPPDGSHTCLVLIGEKEDQPNMMIRMTGFYTHLGWYIHSYPLNFRTSEMIKWGRDIDVRYWKKSIDLPSV